MKFFNITFSLPGKDFLTYFPGSKNLNLIKNISSISIPESIVQIVPECFMGCSLLTNISIPNSVISIGKKAFYECSLLTNISIPNSVISIGSYAFYGCALLINISIPNSVKKIGKNAFSGCASLTNISIPNNVKKIGNNILPASFLFKKSNLRSIQISNVIKSFNRRIVFGKKYLCSIEIPIQSNMLIIQNLILVLTIISLLQIELNIFQNMLFTILL